MPADGKNQKQAIVADLLIRDVEIFDGSGDAPQRGSCAIADGRIISLSTAESRADTQPIRAKQEIDGSGFALAPGFIDIHTHDDMAVFDSKRMKAKLSQGVTTVVVGNCGISASPSPLARHSTLTLHLICLVTTARSVLLMPMIIWRHWLPPHPR